MRKLECKHGTSCQSAHVMLTMPACWLEYLQQAGYDKGISATDAIRLALTKAYKQLRQDKQ